MHRYISRFIILIFIIIWILLYYRKNFLIPKILKEFIPRHKKLTELLEKVVPLLDKCNISHFIEAGTCLGYARHNKSYIPWDDDIDIGIIYNKDTESNIKLLKKYLSSYKDIRLEKIWFGYQIKLNNVWIDLFLYLKKNDIYYSKWDPKIHFPIDSLFPFKKDYFDNVLVNIPNNHKKYLKILYGNDCLRYYKLTKIHKRNLDNIISFVLQEIPIYV